MRFYLNQIAETSGMGTSRWINNYVKEFPIPIGPQKLEALIIDLVMNILKEKKANPEKNTGQLEKKIDDLVYKLYDLTKEEIELLEGGR
jgi:type II restriction/modification system DNA methylase subunit YeeA